MHFRKSDIQFLGHEFSRNVIIYMLTYKTNGRKVDEAILSFPKPVTIAELRQFLCMIIFYRPHSPKIVKCQSTLNI